MRYNIPTPWYNYLLAEEPDYQTEKKRHRDIDIAPSDIDVANNPDISDTFL